MVARTRMRPRSASSFRTRLGQMLSDGFTVANYRAGLGLTGTTNCSAWANQMGIAGSLVQAVGAAQPAIQADGTLLFNGTSHVLKAAPFTLIQPETVYIVFKQVTWTNTDKFFDGDTTNSGMLSQQSATPTIGASADGVAIQYSAALALNTYGVVTTVFNGASSSIAVNKGAATVGNMGAGNMSGFTLGARGAGDLSFGNFQVKEIIIRNVADSAATQSRIITQLMGIHGI